jgi:hypothetical protein
MKDHVACTTQDALRLPLGKDALLCVRLAKGQRCEQHGLRFAEGIANGQWRVANDVPRLPDGTDALLCVHIRQGPTARYGYVIC